MLSHILTLIGEDGLNVADLLNKSVGNTAYNIIDLDGVPKDTLLAQIRGLDGVLNLRVIGG
jgi:D-3-phosphoglycerate dehydrogenase